jgi:Fe-S-cluster containining protein
MNLPDKLAALEKIFGIYDEFAVSLEVACKKYCAHCCTTSVTLTTAEGYTIFKRLEAQKEQDWIDKIRKASEQPHFQPKITTNQLANMCAEGLDLPAEKNDGWSECPFLRDNQCPIYGARPFGCRCLVSRHDCGKEGYADIDDFVLSVNTLFLQTIEHLDAGGCTGNLLDMLDVMAEAENRKAYEDNRLTCAAAGLITNQALKILMIPPEHRSRMEPILQSLRDIRI